MAIDEQTMAFQSVVDRWAQDVEAAGVDPDNPTEEADFLLTMRLLLAFGPQAAFGRDMGKRLAKMSDEELADLFGGEPQG